MAPHAAKAASTIPIVFVSSADPIQHGFVASLARPAGNATGVTLLLDVSASKRLEFLKEAVPRVRHAAFLWNPDHPDNELREAQRAAQTLNMQLRLVEMRGSGDLDNAFRAVIDGGCDALYVVSSRHTVLNIPPIVDFATRNKLPLAGGSGSLGACRRTSLLRSEHQRHDAARRQLFGQNTEGGKTGRSAGSAANQIELIINAKAGKAIGIDVPPTLLARADEVIE